VQVSTELPKLSTLTAPASARPGPLSLSDSNHKREKFRQKQSHTYSNRGKPRQLAEVAAVAAAVEGVEEGLRQIRCYGTHLV
jgi:hypothetical protein